MIKYCSIIYTYILLAFYLQYYLMQRSLRYEFILKSLRPHGRFYLPRLPLKFMTVESSKESIKSTSLLREYIKPKIIMSSALAIRHLIGDICFNICTRASFRDSVIHSIPSYA